MDDIMRALEATLSKLAEVSEELGATRAKLDRALAERRQYFEERGEALAELEQYKTALARYEKEVNNG